jgi:hypothetical protein
MKKLFALLIIALSFLTACEKEKEKDLPCPVIDAKLIPAAVASTFSIKYPNQVVITWFNKDNKGYGAYLLNNGVKTLALFTNDGSFIKEEVKGMHQEGEGDKDENEDDEEGCDCDID